MITSTTPDTWQDLEGAVGRLLDECGMEVTAPIVIETVRGKVEIDIMATETIKGRNYTIFCECKNWKNAIPQQVIHGFRTVVQDAGAHKGYIVSAAGFQSGAISATDRTNIELVTWEEFQNAFEATWLETFFSPTLTQELDPLMSYVEPLAPDWFPELPKADRKEFNDLRNKYAVFGWLIMSVSTYGHLMRQGNWPTLPIRPTVDEMEFEHVPAEILDAVGYREFMESSIDFGKGCIEKFRAIRDRNGKHGGE